MGFFYERRFKKHKFLNLGKQDLRIQTARHTVLREK